MMDRCEDEIMKTERSGRRAAVRLPYGWHLAWQSLKHPDTLLPVAGLAVCFVWLAACAGAYLGLYQLLEAPAVIQAEAVSFPAERRQAVTGLAAVEAVTVCSRTSAQLQWEDYTGTVTVYGVDSDYMNWLSGQSLTAKAAFSGGMAYGILSEAVLPELTQTSENGSSAGNLTGDTASDTASDKKADTLDLTDTDLMKDFTLNGTGSVRLYGLLGDSGQKSPSAGETAGDGAGDENAYGLDEMAGLYLAQDWYRALLENDHEETDGSAGAYTGASEPVSLLIIVRHGRQTADVLTALAGIGITGESRVISRMEAVNEENLTMLETGLIILICSLCVLIYQEKLWTERHPNLLTDLQRFYGSEKAPRRFLRRRRALLLAMGLIGSFLWQWISVIYEWI